MRPDVLNAPDARLTVLSVLLGAADVIEGQGCLLHDRSAARHEAIGVARVVPAVMRMIDPDPHISRAKQAARREGNRGDRGRS